MKSIKPGRGPSAMGGMGSVFAAVFGVIWTVVAASSGAPWFFCLFGVLFILMAVVQALYHFKNASSKERFSLYDVVDSAEEGDPAGRLVAGEEDFTEETARESTGEAGNVREPGCVRFCPYCGAKVERDYKFCAECGKELPE